MWSDNSAHSEFATRPFLLLAEANHYRAHKPVAAVSIPDTASIASHNVKPRPGRACDLCRRRKTKCDGPSAPDNTCSNCVQNNQSCTYLCAYMRILLSFHVSHPSLAKPLAQEVRQKRSSHSSLFARFYLKPTLAPQLCLWPRRPSGEDASTTQESAYHTNLSSPPPSEPNRPVTQLRPEFDFTQHLGPPIVKDSWKSDAEPSISAPRPLVKRENNPTSLNPLDHSLKSHRKSSDSQQGDLLSSDDEDPPFECAKRRLDTPVHSDDEIDKEDGDAGVDRGSRLYGKSADIHLVGPTVFWKYLHIKEVTPPDPQPEAHPPDPGTFPKVRRPIYWGPPFPVSNHPALLPCGHLTPVDPPVGTGMGRCPFDNPRPLSFRQR